MNAFWVKVFPCLPSAVMEWHSMPFSLLNGIFVTALWIQPALSLKPQTESRENMRMKPFTADFTVSSTNNDAFITSTAQQTKKAFFWHTTRCDIRQYNDIHYVCNTCTIFIASQHWASCISAFHQLEPPLISQLSTHSLRTVGSSATAQQLATCQGLPPQ